MSVAGQIREEVLAEVARQLPDMVRKLVRAELRKIQQDGVKPTEKPEDQGITTFTETGTDTGADSGTDTGTGSSESAPRGRRRRTDTT